jgi:hypothetical protein
MNKIVKKVIHRCLFFLIYVRLMNGLLTCNPRFVLAAGQCCVSCIPLNAAGPPVIIFRCYKLVPRTVMQFLLTLCKSDKHATAVESVLFHLE